MKSKEENEIFCKKIVVNNLNREGVPSVYFAIIIKEEDGFLHFKTKNKNYAISKLLILKIEDTDRVFEGVEKC